MCFVIRFAIIGNAIVTIIKFICILLIMVFPQTRLLEHVQIYDIFIIRANRLILRSA